MIQDEFSSFILLFRSVPILDALNCFYTSNEKEFMDKYYETIFYKIDGAVEMNYRNLLDASGYMTLKDMIYFLGMYCEPRMYWFLKYT